MGVEEEGMYLRDMVIRVIPNDFACSYIRPSTSLDTALVHSETKPRQVEYMWRRGIHTV